MKKRYWQRYIGGVTVVAAVAAVAVIAAVTNGGTSGGQVKVGSSTATPVPLQVQSVPAAGATPLPSVLPIPNAPSGVVGTSTNPLGSPVQSLASCAAAALSPPMALTVTLTNGGFGAACYAVSATGATSVALADQVTNSGTGLTIPAELTVSTLLKPVVAQLASTGPNTPSMPGLTVQTQPSASLTLANAIFTSPTAPDSSPIGFSLPALTVGQYLLQLPTEPNLPSAVLTVVPTAPVAGTTPPPVGGASPNVPGAMATRPAAPDEAALITAFGKWEHLPTTCPATTVSGSERFATVTASGTEWAIAKFQPAPSCSYSLAPVTPGGPERAVAPNSIGPFAEPGGPLGVFEKMTGGPWTMNEEGGRPFPCPAPDGAQPGLYNGALPAAVLTVWGLNYASTCAFPVYPLQPRS